MKELPVCSDAGTQFDCFTHKFPREMKARPQAVLASKSYEAPAIFLPSHFPLCEIRCGDRFRKRRHIASGTTVDCWRIFPLKSLQWMKQQAFMEQRPDGFGAMGNRSEFGTRNNTEFPV